MSIYRWKPGAVIHNIDPQAAGEELDAIRRHHNKLDAESVLLEAADRRSVLHPYFDWDDKSAAHKWRLDQAQYLIRHLDVVISGEGEDERTIRAFVNVVEEEARHYVSVSDAMRDPVLREQVVARAFAELESWRHRHSELTEFARVFSTVDKLKERRKG